MSKSHSEAIKNGRSADDYDNRKGGTKILENK
jgi:hypothetical protein